LTALAEDAASRRLDGSTEVSLEDIVRLVRVAQAAVKALCLKLAAAAAPPTLRDYVAARSTASSKPRGATEAAGALADEKSHQRSPQGCGEASEL
jgi:hypothetical protein